MRLGWYRAQRVDPYYNLALERYLLEHGANDQVILYLWQNQNTVVIGRNQSALAECHIRNLEEDGGYLARRLSGGGAVFHDLGNLNFTFLVSSDLFSEEKQTRVVLEAVRLLGVEAERTGRNDLLVQGAKFSGHAYYHSRGRSYHHGTLLVNTDAEKIAKYLNPSPLKLASKGVSSVRSRVCNLCDHIPDLSIDRVAEAMLRAFESVYDNRASHIEDSSIAAQEIEALREEFASRTWLLKGEEVLGHSAETRFSWGCVRVDWSEQAGAFDKVVLFSDGLDADFLDAIPYALCGCPREKEAICKTLDPLVVFSASSTEEEKTQCIRDIANLVCEERL